MAETCTHQDQIKSVKPSGETCRDCAAAGTQPVALRMCLSCGNVGCCDSSVGQHARKHFNESGHAVMQSFKTGAAEEWRYCYVDLMLLEPAAK